MKNKEKSLRFEKKHMGKIFFIMGKSASGKDTVYKELMGRRMESSIILRTAGFWRSAADPGA